MCLCARLSLAAVSIILARCAMIHAAIEDRPWRRCDFFFFRILILIFPFLGGAVSVWRVPARVNDAPAVGACRLSPAGCRLMDCVNADVGSTCGRAHRVCVCVGMYSLSNAVPSVGIQIIQAPNHSASESGARRNLSLNPISISQRV